MLDVGGGRGNDGGGGVAEEREREKGVGTRWERGGNEVEEEGNCHPGAWFQFRLSLAAILKAFPCRYTCCSG